MTATATQPTNQETDIQPIDSHGHGWLSERIRLSLIERGIRPSQVARVSGMSASQAGSWIKGVNGITSRTLSIIAEAYGYDLAPTKAEAVTAAIPRLDGQTDLADREQLSERIRQAETRLARSESANDAISAKFHEVSRRLLTLAKLVDTGKEIAGDAKKSD